MACRTWDQYERYLLQKWPLTRREVQIALERIKGKKNKEIASLLGIGAETVNKTLDQIYRATGVNGRDQLVAKLLIADLDDTPLEQSLRLAGEGAALVGAGFMTTLYKARGERKGQRSLRPGLPTSDSAENRSERVESPAANGRAGRSEHTVTTVGSKRQAHLGVTEETASSAREDLPG